MAVDGPLNVIALISGGKDSFFSILHCLANGHRVVALANLHPPDHHPHASATTPASHPGATRWSISDAPAPLGPSTDAGHSLSQHDSEGADETDLNSFMYQTVGHQVVPLYATATGLPLFRRAITGTTVDHGISYQDPAFSSTPLSKAEGLQGPQQPTSGSGAVVVDETESLVPLLRSVIAAHPEANAVCTGAILSTYQRTRYPVLPPAPATASVEEDPHSQPDDAQLLREMESAGLEARIVKVASAGLDEDFIWENVASEKSIQRVKRVLRKFGGGGRGSELGEGDDDRKVVREGGGSLWLSIRKACVEMKPLGQSSDEQVVEEPIVCTPALLDARFEAILQTLRNHGQQPSDGFEEVPLALLPQSSGVVASSVPEQWCLLGSSQEANIEGQTQRLVDTVHQRLHDKSLAASAITNTIIVLRHMSDFPTINKLYGGLFREPNPPARVTIASGDCLPHGCGIAIYLTVQPSLGWDDRQGLHVQSRSYWAPANIGPYSQAIAFPVPSHAGDNIVTRLTTIAGQIPLVPASMVLPVSGDSSDGDDMDLQITLALQHLWRIGTEMQVQWWTSAVAYFPRAPSSAHMKRQAILAAHAWDEAHIWGLATEVSDDDDETGPDLWDRKFNPQYMSLTGSGDDDAASPNLPDWDSLTSACLADDVNDGGEADVARLRRRYIPYMFAAEVDELPRAAGIEWQAHLGLAKVGSGSVHIFARSTAGRGEDRRLELHHVVVRSPAGGDICVHTTAALLLNEGDTDGTLPSSPADSGLEIDAISAEVNADLETLLDNTHSEAVSPSSPYLTYTDASLVSSPFTKMTDATPASSASAVIPCYSLWNARGSRLSIVALFQSHYSKEVVE
ncbi:hypothetical protein PG991_004439 [Apiospora marii]|uniref:Diphthine--ammonia ligase n=1 Tax=Apiospora marii TaxID=335849 RepID=A0ABR1S6B4_9PEZI